MAFLNEDGLQEFAKLLIEEGEWLGANPDDNYWDYDSGNYGVRANYARKAGEADFAVQADTAFELYTPRQIALEGAIQGNVQFNGSQDVTINTFYPGEESSQESTLSYLKNGKGGMLNWLWVTGADGETDYVLVPRSLKENKTYDAYLGDSGHRFLGLYTGFIDASGSIQSGGNMVCGGSLTTSGNIVTSNVTASGNLYAQGSGDNGGIVQAKKQLYSEGILTVADTAAIGGITTVAACIQPNPNSTTVNLGYNDIAGHRWSNIYSKTAVNVSSDEKVKTNLERIDDKYIQLFDLVQPYSYQFIDGTSGRTHTGFVSQHVEAAMKEVGLESTDLAFFCKDPLYKEVRNEEGEIVDTEPSLDENGNQEYFYSLRYEEYIAIMTEKIKRMEQKHAEEKADFEARLSALESKLSSM
jgi:hypothetical protein